MKPVAHNKAFDREIKRLLRFHESEVPTLLDKEIQKQIYSFNPLYETEKPKILPLKRNYKLIVLEALAAAVILIFTLLFFFPIFQGQPPAAEAGEILIHDATIEGKPAFTITIRNSNPDFTIIWIEPIKKNFDIHKNNSQGEEK